ncbi:ABC transporter ATP-binding protein [Spiroplasma diminutum]|uniref:ABC transporter ATP-binding protein/permease n=1 Tax=Spiroplasma diminutum CUAS-1 TaxID=1276221 RepID=S5MIY1_9MOLU|nr:ABC transporter ATP-binding protein/permease [Spiroplasma diminutum]AGR41895.1 ABC transporter ATP-binding protein/permease [Spiroplasma diminutum CUAS-1]
MKRKKFNSDKAFSAKKFADSFKMIGECIRKNPGIFAGYIIFTIIDSIFYSSMTIVVSQMTKNLTSQGEQGNVFLNFSMTWVSWIYVGLALLFLIIIFDYLTNIYAAYFSKRVEIYLRIKALKKLVDIDISYYSKNQLGLIMSRVINDSQGSGDSFNDFLLNLLFSFVSFATMLVFMFILDLILTLIVLLVFTILVIVIWVIFVYYRRAIIISIDVKQAIDADITDRLINIRAIKANAAEERETKRNLQLHEQYDKKLSKVIWLQSLLAFFSYTIAWSLPIITIIATIALYSNSMDPNELSYLIVAFTSATNNILYALLTLPIWMRGLTKLSNCIMRLNYIYDSRSLLKFVDNPKEIGDIEKISFNKVTFNYPESPGKQILAEVSFDFEKNKSYAFVGETGVGKSTIAKLLLRFYDVTTGELLINGTNIKLIDHNQYLNKVGYVEQEPQIFYGTVMENLKYPLFDKSDEQAIEAAKKAKIHNYIKKLPKGYDTILGERGFMFSGGQKQRLVIARIFLKDPQLLILDEATSALDNVVEKEIQTELDKLMVGRTTVVIAHRLSTIKNVDEIIVLDKNGVAQRGTFYELKEKEGRFKKLYTLGLMK